MSEAVTRERPDENRDVREPTPAERSRDGGDEPELSPAELLALLDAEYTRAILAAAGQRARSARAIAEEVGASRATVYRRLDSLQEAGLVETGMQYDADGHHRAVFEATLETLSIDVTGDGLSVTVTTSGSEDSAAPALDAQ
jgi:AcrR family transcriptional regulator